MTNLDFYINMIIGSEPLSDLRKTWVRNMIRVIKKNTWYTRENNESPRLDRIYDELIKYKVKSDQAKSHSQLETLIRSINGKTRD